MCLFEATHASLCYDKMQKRGRGQWGTIIISPKYEHVILHYISRIYKNCSRSVQFIANMATYYMT